MKLYSRKMEPLASDSFETRIVRALESQGTAPQVPADFAARVTVGLPAPRPARPTSHAGRTAAVTMVALLMAVLIALAPRSSAGRGYAFDLELTAAILLAALVWGLAKVWDRV